MLLFNLQHKLPEDLPRVSGFILSDTDPVRRTYYYPHRLNLTVGISPYSMRMQMSADNNERRRWPIVSIVL